MSEQTKFKGWPILIACFVLMFCMLGGVQTFAVFIAPIMSETGFSLGAVAMMSTLATIGSFIGNMLFSRIFKVLGAKWLLVVCSIICAVYFIGTSYAQTLFGMYAAMAIGGFSTGVGTIAPLSVIMTNWFIKKRATYMSIVIAGSMFGGALLMPVSGFLVEMFDWRIAFRLLGIGIGIISVLTSLFVIVEKPEQKGLLAYGAGDTSSAETRAANAEAAGGVTPKEARSSLAFWLLIVGILFIGCSTNIENFLPAYWRSQGISVAMASSIMGIYALIAGVCAIVLGRITDKLGGKTYVLMTCIFFVIGTIGIYFLGAAAMPIIIMMCIPFALGGKKTSNLTPPLVISQAFGRKHYGAIIGAFTGMFQLGIALSNPIISSLHKISGGYQMPFMAMAVLNIVAFVMIFVALKVAPYRSQAVPAMVKPDTVSQATLKTPQPA